MQEKNTARVRGENFEFEDFAGYEFGIDGKAGGGATIALKFRVSDATEGLKLAQRLEDLRRVGVSGA